ncbi:MAG TPA: LytR C-terminal domain-containing protein [Acidimicrobiales bacterium]|nr:LytR C-terminal domain-containing protein [Acidimicrobiales bacterium]
MSTIPPGQPGPGPAGGGGSPGRGAPPSVNRLLRGGLVLIVAVVVAVVVIARLGSTTKPASSAHLTTTTTTTKAAVSTTATTAPPGSSTTTLPATTTTALPPRTVLVRVLNGWTTRHAALYFKNQLATFGYDLGVPIDAATSDNKISQVFYLHPQYLASALAIASELGIAASSVLAPTTANSSALTAADEASTDVIVVVGEDISGKVPVGYNG